MKRAVPDSERGSVLIEALIASLIVAATVGTAFEVIGGTAARTAALGDRQRAMLVAQSQLAGANLAVALDGTRTSGIDGDLAWTLTVAPAPGYAPEPMAAVTVRVVRARGGPVLATLSTLRMANR